MFYIPKKYGFYLGPFVVGFRITPSGSAEGRAIGCPLEECLGPEVERGSFRRMRRKGDLEK